MQILSIYLLVGTLFSALADYAHSKAKDTWPVSSINDWESSRLNNFDRFWLIILWPLGLVLALVKIFSNKV